MKHKWYSGFDWEGLLKKQLEVPIEPQVRTYCRSFACCVRRATKRAIFFSVEQCWTPKLSQKKKLLSASCEQFEQWSAKNIRGMRPSLYRRA